MAKITLNTDVLKLGQKFVGVARPGGFTVRGAPALTAEGAFRNLLWTLSGNGPQNDDAELGVSLLVQGTTLERAMAEQEALPPADEVADEVADEATPWTRS